MAVIDKLDIRRAQVEIDGDRRRGPSHKTGSRCAVALDGGSSDGYGVTNLPAAVPVRLRWRPALRGTSSATTTLSSATSTALDYRDLDHGGGGLPTYGRRH